MLPGGGAWGVAVGYTEGEGEGTYWVVRGGGKLGLDTEREWEGRWDWETEFRKGCWGGLNAGKGRWKLVFDLEIELEAEGEGEEELELDQGVYVIAPTYGLEYRSQHFRHGCVGSKFLNPVLLPMREKKQGRRLA